MQFYYVFKKMEYYIKNYRKNPFQLRNLALDKRKVKKNTKYLYFEI